MLFVPLKMVMPAYLPFVFNRLIKASYGFLKYLSSSRKVLYDFIRYLHTSVKPPSVFLKRFRTSAKPLLISRRRSYESLKPLFDFRKWFCKTMKPLSFSFGGFCNKLGQLRHILVYRLGKNGILHIIIYKINLKCVEFRFFSLYLRPLKSIQICKKHFCTIH